MSLPVPDDADPLVRLRKIVHALRSPGGCPWDIEQTHESLIPNLIEEAYECAQAIREGATDDMQEELGDLFLQVIMHAEIAGETDRFSLESIAATVADKLVHRHPHVFGDVSADDTETVLKNWDTLKRAEKGINEHPFLHKVGDGLPALLTATKLQKRAAKVGFDWPNTEDVLEKIREEFEEVVEAKESNSPDRLEEELGDLLFALVNYIRHEKLDAESILTAANEKFRHRFHKVEKFLKDSGKSLESASLEEMDNIWNAIKHENSTS